MGPDARRPAHSDSSSGSALKAARALCITGWGRSGSTVVESLVAASAPGIVPVGHLTQLWSRGPADTWCSCQRLVVECAFWKSVLGQFDDWEARAARLGRIRREQFRLKFLPRLVAHRRVYDDPDSEIAYYADTVWQLYDTIAAATNSSVVVDTSLSGVHLLATSTARARDVRPVHVIRKPARVIASWKRTEADSKRDPDGRAPMNRFGTLESTRRWVITNLLSWYGSRATGRGGVRLPFEFVSEDHPRDWTSWTEEQLDLAGFGDALERARTPPGLELPQSHRIGGDSSVLRQARLVIRGDDRWREQLTLVERLMGDALGIAAWRWLHRPQPIRGSPR